MSEPTTESGRYLYAVKTGFTDGQRRNIRRLAVAIEQEAVRAYAERLAAAVREMTPTVVAHTCWDNHEGEGGSHLDGSPCRDEPRESVNRAAILRLIEGSKP